MEGKIHVLIPEEKVQARLDELAAQINADYEGKQIHLICVLKGGVFAACELAKRITLPLTMDFMSVSSYGDATVSSGLVRIVKDLDEPIENKHVLIAEDIIDSGNTLHHLLEILTSRRPADIQICTLLDKPDRRTAQVEVKYTGFSIPDKFVIGCGLDYKQLYRNLPYVGVIE